MGSDFGKEKMGLDGGCERGERQRWPRSSAPLSCKKMVALACLVVLLLGGGGGSPTLLMGADAEEVVGDGATVRIPLVAPGQGYRIPAAGSDGSLRRSRREATPQEEEGKEILKEEKEESAEKDKDHRYVSYYIFIYIFIASAGNYQM